VKGVSSANTITGNKYKNNIQGNGGNDTIDGGSDLDIATYSGNFSDYAFSIANKIVSVTDNRSSTNDGIDQLSNIEKLTFDQVTGLNTDSGKMFRLYNASFKRLPDPAGLRYWIDNFSSGKDDERVVASSFLASAEFKQRYGENVSNESYVETLYENVLGRDYDQAGYNYWLANLNNGIETRYELLLGFSESAENKSLFSEMTGLY